MKTGTCRNDQNEGCEQTYGNAICAESGKQLFKDTDFGRYAFSGKTHVIMKEDKLEDVLDTYLKDYLIEEMRCSSPKKSWQSHRDVPSP